jgi:hypothetical protein
MMARFILLGLIASASLMVSGQNRNSRTILGEEFTKVQLKESLTNTTLHNVFNDGRELIVDEKTVVAIAEIILFKTYGQKNIEKQRPYEVYKIDSFWSISGTLPKEMLGGTFLIIIDSRDCSVIRLTHGK